jgi:diguanylate cyclase (GGDEF)-like protein
MSLTAAVAGHRHEAATEHPAVNVISLARATAPDPGRMLGWALAAIAEAEKHLASLQARITYLESLSATDELTGLYNRRGFLTELDHALARARRGGAPGVLMVGDLDGFKAVNDRFGHAGGDAALRHVAALLESRVRRGDAVARLGGDEFGVFLGGATLAAGRRKAKALAEIVASAPMDACLFGARLGISFGVVAFDGEASAEDLLHRADLAMYRRKRRRVVA